MQRAVLPGPCPGRRPTQSQRGSATPSRWLPLATDSESINLAATAAALVPFQIGLALLRYPPYATWNILIFNNE